MEKILQISGLVVTSTIHENISSKISETKKRTSVSGTNQEHSNGIPVQQYVRALSEVNESMLKMINDDLEPGHAEDHQLYDSSR